MEKTEIENVAKEIESWLQDAVGDMANVEFDYLDNKWKDKVTKAKINGLIDLNVMYLSEWLADEYYNDVDTLYDLCTDHIYDASGGDICAMILIAKEIQSESHDALKTAMQQYIDSKQKTIKEALEEKSKIITIGN